MEASVVLQLCLQIRLDIGDSAQWAQARGGAAGTDRLIDGSWKRLHHGNAVCRWKSGSSQVSIALPAALQMGIRS
jgi:hypothetical protein